MIQKPQIAWGILWAACSTLFGNAAQAIEVKVQPTKVRLGDTVSILVTPDSGETLTEAPTVKVADKTFPAFQVAPNRWRALVPTTPLEKHGRRSLTVTGNQQTRNMLLWIGSRRFPTQRIWLPPKKKTTVTDPNYEFRQAAKFKALVTPEKYWNGTFVRPNAGRSSTGYGVRRYYNGVFAKDYYHRGLDYANSTGSPVKAAAAGKVSLIGRESEGFRVHGNVVGLDHGQGVGTIYLHLSRIDVQPGQTVASGQVIGAVGSTGASTGPHLHWGLYVNGQAVDPSPWLWRGFD
ncbi:MAG: M23 family metallopeptidase [Cyanobacteria bacterium P01_A01_bin.17]